MKRESRSPAAIDARIHSPLWTLRGNKLREAEEQARQALWQRPTSAEARAILARGHSDRGDDAEAVRLLHQALYHDPDHHPAHDLLVHILKQSDRHADALEIYSAWAVSVFKTKSFTQEPDACTQAP